MNDLITYVKEGKKNVAIGIKISYNNRNVLLRQFFRNMEKIIWRGKEK